MQPLPISTQSQTSTTHQTAISSPSVEVNYAYNKYSMQHDIHSCIYIYIGEIIVPMW